MGGSEHCDPPRAAGSDSYPWGIQGIISHVYIESTMLPRKAGYLEGCGRDLFVESWLVGVLK